MAAPYPYEAVSGRISLAQRANEIYSHYVWLARWSDEIGTDPDVDLKKLAQLAFIHCRLFGNLLDTYGVEAAGAIRQRFAASNVAWATPAAMAADLTALRNQANLLFVFVRDNVPEAREASKVAYDPLTDSGTEQPIKLPKPHPAVAEVAALRALFA